jgi:hypothetical protein
MPIGETDVGIILSKKTNRIGIASMMVGSRPMKAACAYNRHQISFRGNRRAEATLPATRSNGWIDKTSRKRNAKRKWLFTKESITDIGFA